MISTNRISPQLHYALFDRYESDFVCVRVCVNGEDMRQHDLWVLAQQVCVSKEGRKAVT
jgi:hypothetical protein